MANKRKHDGSDDGPSKFLRSDYNATIRVLVGDCQAPFTVHQDLLCRHSGFFEKACSGEWKEARERTVRLNESDATSFQIYLNHLYSPHFDLNSLMCEIRFSFNFANSGRLGTLSSQDHDFQNDVIDAMQHNITTALTAVSPSLMLEWVISNTTSDSPLRKWLAHVLAPHLKASPQTVTLLDDLTGKLPAEFLMDLLKARAASLPTNTKSASVPGDKCRFHVHPEGMPKCV
ncbi:hypothetical protein LTR10_011294 [Elasticomyces elasticus]|nr:hypothetical protein LTR10_011294 [Elasticomyces elasticus]KAK4966291.1 hypothetical protein LTR42_011452 [Elasticomyces elasticus]